MSDRREGAAASAQAAAVGGNPSQLPPPMFTDAQLRRLKAAVIIMGVVLILGFGVVIFRIIHLLGRAGPPAPTSSAPATLSAPRPEVVLELPEGAQARHVSLAGDQLVIHYDAPSGGAIAIVDLATGRVQRVRLVPRGSSR